MNMYDQYKQNRKKPGEEELIAGATTGQVSDQLKIKAQPTGINTTIT